MDAGSFSAGGDGGAVAGRGLAWGVDTEVSFDDPLSPQQQTSNTT